MATLLSVSTGNLSATASWAVVEPTSFQGTPNVLTSNNMSATSQYVGTTFVLASATTVAGVAIQLSGRAAGAAGTLNVQLFNVTSATIIAQVTINQTDLPNTQTVGANHIDWTYFKFATPVTTVAGNSYSIRMTSSAVVSVSYYYTTAINNMNRALVTTTNQAPVTSDILIVAGQYTSAGVNAPVVITMDLPSITLGNVWVSPLGTLQHTTTSSTTMSLSGYLVIGVAGTYTIGTSVAPISSSYSVTITMNCTTALQYPIWVYGTMRTYGATKTIATKLAADVIVGATTSTTTTATGWLNGDIIGIPSTTRTYSQYETKTLSTDASGITLTHNAYTFAHGGNVTTKVQADVVNLTRNIRITGAGVVLANKTNIQMFATSVTSFYYTQFRYLGTGIAITNSGICVNVLTSGIGTFEMQYCSMIDGTQTAANTANTALQTSSSTGTLISNNIFFGLGWNATTVSSIIVTQIDDGNYIIGSIPATQAILATFMGSNNVVASTSAVGATTGFLNNATNNSFYSNFTIGLNMTNPSTLGNTNLSNFLIWRNNTYGIAFTISSTGYQRDNIVSFTGLYCFGNTTASLNTLIRIFEKIYFINSFFYGGTTLVQPTHYITGATVDSIYYNNCYFGYSNSSLTLSPFSGAILQGPQPGIAKIFNGCYFNGTEISTTAGATIVNMLGTYISLNHNGVTASNKQWLSNGIITTDTIISSFGVRSLRLTPSSALYKLTTPLVKVPVKIGTICTVNVRLRRSLVGDGAVYNGNTPRLMYAFNPVLGNLTETIGATIVTNNLILSTAAENFSLAPWNGFGITITQNSTTDPNGNVTADTITAVNVSAYRAYPLVKSTSAITYTGSIYAKKGINDWIRFGINDENQGAYVWFNLNTGLAGSAQASAPFILNSYSIESVGNGWYLLTVNTTSSTLTTLQLLFNFADGNGTLNTIIGSTYFLWGAQLVVGGSQTYTPEGSWQNLTYTTATFSNDGVAEFYVDCDGTTGWINVDNWDVTTSVDSRGNDYWSVNGTYVEPDFKRPIKSYTFIN